MRKKTATATQETEGAGEQAVPSRKRLSVEEREKQILASAIQFFSEHGLNGQMRVLAQQMGITHTLFYHYFPTKQALIDRVYYELFEGRWKPEWQALLDDPARRAAMGEAGRAVATAHADLPARTARALLDLMGPP